MLLYLVSTQVDGAPANDHCDSAIPMVANVVYTNNTEDATSTLDPVPACVSGFGKGVWYSFKPQLPGLVTISTCGSGFDTGLAVYTGSCGSFITLSNWCNNDDGPACAGTASSLTLSVVANVTYRILVGGCNGEGGNLKISITDPLPTNDICSGAVPMTSGITYTINTIYATSNGDPVPTCVNGFGKGVWYSFTPPTNGSVQIKTCGSAFDTAMAIYAGSCEVFTPLPEACNDNDHFFCAGTEAALAFKATPGTKYWVLVGGNGGASGNLKITATFFPTAWQEVLSPIVVGSSIARLDTNFIHIIDQTNNCLLTFDTDTGTFVSSIRLRGPAGFTTLSGPDRMAFSTDGDLLYVPLTSSQKLQVISLTNLVTLDIVPLTVRPASVAAGFDGMAYVLADGGITTIDPTTGEDVGCVSNSWHSPLLKPNLSGTRLYVMEQGLTGGSSKIDEFAIVPNSLPMYVTNHYHTKQNDKDFVIAEDIGWLYATGGGLYGIGAWDMTNRTESFWPLNAAYGAAVAMFPNDQFVYCASVTLPPRIRRFDRLTGAVSATFDLDGDAGILVRSLQVTPNGRVFFAREGRSIGLIGATALITNLPATAEVVDGGPDRTVVSGETFELNAVAPMPSQGDTYTWAIISGPESGTFSAPNGTNTTLQISTPGSYVLQVVRANGALKSRDRIHVSVLPRPLKITSTGFTEDGHFQLTLSGQSGPFIVEATTDFVHWETVTNVSNAPGDVTIIDSAMNQSARFYRARMNP